MSNYPASIDNSISLPLSTDSLTPVMSDVTNRLRNAILAIEGELGVKPSASYGTVKGRLDTLENVVGNLVVINLSGDLGGTVSAPIVIGLQGRPISDQAPSIGDVLTWNGVAWVPFVSSGGGSGLPPGTEVGQTAVWDGSEYDIRFAFFDDIIPPLVVDLVGTELYEVGETVTNPAFTATYSEVPVEVLLKDSDNDIDQDVTDTPGAFNSDYVFTKNTFAAEVTFTLTAAQGINGHIVKSDDLIAIWAQKLYYGKGSAGESSEAFVEALSGSQLTLTKEFSFNITTGVGEKIYFVCRSAYGEVFFAIQNVPGGFTLTHTITITNAHGFAENYDIYESDDDDLGNVNVYTE